VPTTPVGGFDGRPGNYIAQGWTADRRFVGLTRGSSRKKGIDIVDTAANERVGSIDTEGTSAHVRVAARGYHFHTMFGEAPVGESSHLARITKDGISTPVSFPPGASPISFSPNGEQLLWTSSDPSARGLFVTRLVDGRVTQVVTAYDGETHSGPSQIDPQDGSIIMLQVRSSGEQAAVLRRVFLDGKSSTVLTDPSRGALRAHLPAAPFFGVHYRDPAGERFELVARESLRRSQVLELPHTDNPKISAGVLDDFVYYHAPGMGLHVVALDDGGNVVDTRISESADGLFICLGDDQPQGKLVFREPTTRNLSLVRLQSPSAPRVASIVPASGARLSCATWAHDQARSPIPRPVTKVRDCSSFRGATPGPLPPNSYTPHRTN
jgi:hypothetical protein